MKRLPHISAVVLFIAACGSTQHASPVVHTGSATDTSTTDDPTGRSTARGEGGELWRTAVDLARVSELAVPVETFAIHGEFQGNQLMVAFRLPEPASPMPWTLVVEGQTLEREIYDADAHPRGGAWVQVERGERTPVPGMIYTGAFSVDLRALIETNAVTPGAAVIVRFGGAQVRVVR